MALSLSKLGMVEHTTDMNTPVRKAYKYKLKPTPAQEQIMAWMLRRCCELYNAAVQERREAWAKCRVSVGLAQQSAQLPTLKEARPEYRDIHSQVLQNVIERVAYAFDRYFERVQTGQKAGYPRFKSHRYYHSLTYKQFGNGARLENGMLVLSKIGHMALRWSRPLEGTPKTVILFREPDGWYVSFSCTEVPLQPLPPTGRETGIDVGLQVFLITSDGDRVENPRHQRKAEKQLKKAHRRVSRRKKGSTRRRKAVKLLAKKHLKVKRQRRDFHFKTALTLLRQYDTIYLEDVQVSNLVRNRHLAKSISDAGWYQFRRILEGKAEHTGRRVVAVPPAYTSQDCSGCGARIQKSLSIRTHACTSCGLVLDRDENAARNIKRLGQSLRGLAVVTAGTNRESPVL